MANGGLQNILKSFKLNEKSISRTLGILVLVIAGVLIFNYFRGFGEKASLEIIEEPGEVTTEAEVVLIEEEGQIVPQGFPKTYIVQAGDDLWKIAETFYRSGYNWVDITEANDLTNPDLIEAGQRLTLPKTAVKSLTVAEPITGNSYLVQEGDYLWEIAVRAYGDGYRWVEIAQANSLANPNLIHPGNTLSLPR